MKQYIVDAFTDKIFGGNQAAVCVLENWISDELMQNIARENNFSETAFTVKEGEKYHLRWFTPAAEIDFCGHATLGTAFVLFNFYEKDADKIDFKTLVGELTVEKQDEFFKLNFPAYRCKKIEVTDKMEEALGVRPKEAYIDRDLLLVLENAGQVRNLRPNQEKLKELDGLCIAVTAPGDTAEYDSVSRVFCPELGLMEDPVTGSSHCMIAPYWCDRLGKEKLVCFQASERTGVLYAERKEGRIILSGKAVLFSEGNILEKQRNTMKNYLRLETERLLLRDYCENDFESYFRLKSDAKTMYYLQDLELHSVEEAKADFENVISDISSLNRKFYFLHIELKDSHEQVGSIGYTVLGNTPVGKIVHLGYFSYPKFWGKGYMSEALKKVLEFAFTQNDVCRVTTGCLAENKGSERVMQKNGMIQEAVHKDYEWHDGKMKTRLEYRLLKNEWEIQAVKKMTVLQTLTFS